MGHPQPPTLIMTDNSTACGIINSTVCQHQTRAINMRFYWVQDCCTQGNFLVYWVPGKNNLGNFHTKHHGTSHNQ
eukprot:9938229-Ditylum_brightwellii.AAC.1